MELLDFFRPDTVKEAKSLLSKYNNTKLLAGGTDLALTLNREKESPQYIIDLARLSELKVIIEEENHIVIGSMVTFSELLQSKCIYDHFKSLVQCANNMGSPQIRNMATIGGNIANAGSAADIVPCIMSLRGTLVIESSHGERRVICEEYFKNYGLEKLKENELLTRIILPKNNELNGYYKLGKRNSLAIARVSACISLKVQQDIIKGMSICLGAVGRFPFRAYEFERCALEKNISWLLSEEPLKLLEHEVYESIKSRNTMPFKREAVKGVYKEALRTILADIQVEG